MTLRIHLSHRAYGSLALKLASISLPLLMVVVMALVPGVDNFGTYAFCLSISQILIVPTMLGEPILLLDVVAYQTKN